MNRSLFTLSATLLLSANMAAAQSSELMFCAIENSPKMVSVTLDGDMISYRYGLLNVMSELVLDSTVADIAYAPWPGVGSSIWETITFTNGAYAYEVSMGFERAPASDDLNGSVTSGNYNGAITVTKDDTEIASLRCIPNSVSFDWSTDLSDAKRAAGLCWSLAEREWEACN